MRRGYVVVIFISIVFLVFFSLYLNLTTGLSLVLIFAIFENLALYFNDVKKPLQASILTFVGGALPVTLLYIMNITTLEILFISLLLIFGASIQSYVLVRHYLQT